MIINKIQLGLIFSVVALGIIAFGSAWNFENFVEVDPNSCIDGDFGIDFTMAGVINFTINSTHYGPFYDFCLNETVYEFACSEQVPEINVTGYAIMVSENCKIALNNTNATCSNGRCI